MKKYVVIAGVNGAGKSTLYQMYDEFKDMPRINVDEIVRDIGNWKNPKDVFAAGKVAVKNINKYLEEGITFNQETTLCGNSIIRNILKAKDSGYFIELHYVGVESAEIAKERVKYRVKQGGHGIPEEDIERRYVETFIQLNRIIKECDLVALYDNSEKFRRFAIYKSGNIVRLSQNVPKWFSKIDV
ncbi:MAG: zeta toxin family protein [Agathobacter sp.]|nr:zeta toxin family protein [Agathobacter sp.]MBQ2902636.1 zeta toxin family protein [Agathobacter sp.]